MGRRSSAVNSQPPSGGEFAQGEFTSPEHFKQREPARLCRVGRQKEMRTLGTVQLPTEAFMAVLKLDEEN